MINATVERLKAILNEMSDGQSKIKELDKMVKKTQEDLKKVPEFLDYQRQRSYHFLGISVYSDEWTEKVSDIQN